MDNSKSAKCKISVYVASGQENLREKRILEGPKSIYVQTPVDGESLMSAVQTEIGSMSELRESVEYTVVLTDMTPPEPRPAVWSSNMGRIYFSERARVPRHLYAEDLVRVIYKALGLGKTPKKIYGIERIPKRGKPVTNELVNQIRDELGI